MRLLISETPERRQFGVSGYTRVLSDDCGGIGCSDEEDVERKLGVWVRGSELGLRSRKVEGSEWLMKEDCPTSSPNSPGDGNAAAVSFKVIAALPADHSIDGTSPIELRTALAKTK
jgi:hypothetical protein